MTFRKESTIVADKRRNEIAVLPRTLPYGDMDAGPSEEHLRWFLLPWATAHETSRQYRILKETLITAAVGFKRYFDFSGHYNSYLAGQLSEDEFQEIAEQFVVEDKGGDNTLLEKIECLLRESGIALYPNELAAFF